MGIFTKMRGWFAPRVERSSSGIPASSGLFGGLGGMQTSSGMLVSMATSMQVSVVYACVRRIATDCARCSGGLFETIDGIQRPTSHGSADLLVRPNSQQTWFEFAEQLHVSELLRGNAYAVALRDRRGNITQMIPINPDFVTILESADGEIFYQVSPCGLWLMAMLRDQPVCIPQEDIFHFKGITFNTLVGVSTISVARDAIGLAIGQEQQAAHWMEAGARPGGILMVDKALSPDAAKRLRDQWNNLKAGIQNVGATAVLEDGVKWQAMQLTAPELDFWTGRNFQIPEICRYFMISPSKIGVAGHGQNQNIAQQEQAYANDVIAPRFDRFEQAWNKFFGLDSQGIKVKFDLSELLRADALTRITIGRTAVMSGLMTPNEFRLSEGLAPIPGGDRLLVPANSAALGSDMTGVAPDQAGRPKDGTMPEPSTPTSGDQPGAQPLDPVVPDGADAGNRSASNDNERAADEDAA